MATLASCARDPTIPSGQTGMPAVDFGIAQCARPNRDNNVRATIRAAPLARRTLTTQPANAANSVGSSADSSPSAIRRWAIRMPGMDMASMASASGEIVAFIEGFIAAFIDSLLGRHHRRGLRYQLKPFEKRTRLGEQMRHRAFEHSVSDRALRASCPSASCRSFGVLL